MHVTTGSLGNAKSFASADIANARRTISARCLYVNTRHCGHYAAYAGLDLFHQLRDPVEFES